MGYKLMTPLRDNKYKIDYGYMCIGTDWDEIYISYPNVDFSKYNNCLQIFALVLKP